MNTTYTIEQIAQIGGVQWINPTTDEVRLYLNNWPELAGLEVSRYKTGNISSATLGGETISNSKARQIIDAIGKVWWSSSDGRIHITLHYESQYAGNAADWIRNGIADAVAAAA